MGAKSAVSQDGAAGASGLGPRDQDGRPEEAIGQSRLGSEILGFDC